MRYLNIKFGITPKFWNKINITSLLLIFCSLPYAIIVFFKAIFINNNRKNKFRLKNKKIITIGNFTVGGSGKTPIEIAIGKILNKSFKNKENNRVAFLLKNYANKIKFFNYLHVNKLSKNDNIIDEALLLSEISDTYLIKNKDIESVKNIGKNIKANILIIDDLFYHKNLNIDLSIIVIDGSYYFGNNLYLPAGPIRDNINMNIRYVNLIIIINDNKDKYKFARNYINNLANKYNIDIIYGFWEILNLDFILNKNIIAFCGLARCDKFFDMISNKCNLVKKIYFKDHHIYKNTELDNIIDIAKKDNLEIVTTKKDWIKFNNYYKSKINFIDIDIKFNNKDYKILNNHLNTL